jgi:hypothetical protein
MFYYAWHKNATAPDYTKSSEIDLGKQDRANLGMNYIDTFISLFC